MTAPIDSTPRADGFSMPGEFASHRGCWMAWPERPDNWRDAAGPAQEAFVAVAEAIHPSDPVTMTVSPAQFANARSRLSPGIRVLEIESDDSWMRDIGPSFVTDGGGGLRAVDWKFNAWGGTVDGLYAPWDRDDAMAARVAEVEGADRYRAPFVLEGGAIHVDGEGTVYTTEECLLSDGRNPGMDRAAIEAGLRDYLGAEKVVWVPRGVILDETTGHVDNILHVCAPGVVALTWTDDADDPQHERSSEALDALLSARDARGRAIEIVKLPMPGPLYMTAEEAAGIAPGAGGMSRAAGERLAGSYSNFYIGNSRVVFPLLDPDHDAEAASILQRLFPDRDIIGVPGREILLGGGNVHCITQQVPR
ncbi:agmatine deiminase [Oceanomicrobium pacificus]|uniref:Putative agmatine deiminase n=1 Tax=Oceanomicrobium pacificus TaxID=2692916 RepID=A0A6B0TKZ6_9RHOB|nr:agmatine deiminase [Oceanomicrobium pacificus]MXU65167.1 agmatine deiminase [Oceanomicrobium pacificus]